MAKTTTTVSMGDLTAKDIRTVRTAFTELLVLGKFDAQLADIADDVLARGDIISPEAKDETAPAPRAPREKKTTGTRLPSAPAATSKSKSDDQESGVVVGRNYTLPGEKFADVVVKYVEPASRAGSGRFRVVVGTDAYPEGKVVVVKTTLPVPTRKGPRG